MNKNIIRIGTRESNLAIWQAQLVQQQLNQNGFKSELIYLKSDGDIDLKTPLYALGVQGIFTKTLDVAILNNQIDIAVHSFKDVPILLAKGISQFAVLKRASHKDVLILKNNINFLSSPNYKATIATSSIRRKAQWLHRFPNHQIVNLRGNVNSRLEKLKESNWDGAIFAKAGLQRISLLPTNAIDLDWMLPAPAQGAIVVVGNENNKKLKTICKILNDDNTFLCTKIERDFLNVLQGGCHIPISALAQIQNNIVYFKASIFSVDGKKKIEIEKETLLNNSTNLGIEAANEILKNNHLELLTSILPNVK